MKSSAASPRPEHSWREAPTTPFAPYFFKFVGFFQKFTKNWRQGGCCRVSMRNYASKNYWFCAERIKTLFPFACPSNPRCPVAPLVVYLPMLTGSYENTLAMRRLRKYLCDASTNYQNLLGVLYQHTPVMLRWNHGNICRLCQLKFNNPVLKKLCILSIFD